MKKILFGMMLLAGAFISCSKDATNLNEEGGAVIDDENVPQPILLSVASNAIEVTRGTGTVGGDGKENKWSKQELHIYAVRKGEIPPTMVNSAGEENWPFDTDRVGNAGRVGEAPEDAVAGDLRWTDNRGNLYYPRTGEFDFWGYYADNAVTAANAKGQYNAAKKYYSVPFTIDGSQDLLRGKAEKNGENAQNAYSAQAARNGIHPKLFFEHLLTRLTFKVKREANNANDKGAAEVYVREVRVKAHNKGNLIFIYSDDKYADSKQAIEWGSGMETLYLKERVGDGSRNMQTLNKKSIDNLRIYNPYSPANKGKYDTKAKLDAAVKQNGLTLADVFGNYNSIDGSAVSIGEALLVSPEAQYDIEIDVAQYYNADENQTLIPEANSSFKYKRTIMASEVQGKNLTKFEPSSSYNVTITVRGLQKISVSTELEKWTSGGDITWDPDKTE